MNSTESQAETKGLETPVTTSQDSNPVPSPPQPEIEASNQEISKSLDREGDELTNGETAATTDEANTSNTPPSQYNNPPNGQHYWRLIPNYYPPSVYPPNTPIYEVTNQPGPHWQQHKQDQIPAGAYMGPYHEGQVPFENYNYQSINYPTYHQQQHAYNAGIGVIDYNTVPWPPHNLLPQQPIPINLHTYQPSYESQTSTKGSISSKAAFNYEDYYSKDKVRASGGLGQTNGSGGVAYHVAPNDPLYYNNDQNNNYYHKNNDRYSANFSSNNQYLKHVSPNGSQKNFLNKSKKNGTSTTNPAESESNKTKRYSDIVSGKQNINADSFSNNSGSELSETHKDDDLNNNNTEQSEQNTKNKYKHSANSTYYKNPVFYPRVYYQNEDQDMIKNDTSYKKKHFYPDPYFQSHNLDTNLLNSMMSLSLATDYNNQRNLKSYKNNAYSKSVYYKQINKKTGADHDRYDPKDFVIPNESEGECSSRFFVIKSYSKDDIIKSIKYNIWCSTEDGNRKLDKAFSESQSTKNSAVYLFFSVNGSGQFCGVAQMLSRIDYDSKSKIWSQDKWNGTFDINWIYVKDVPNVKLRHILLRNNENKPVTNSRDTQEVEFDEACEVLSIIRQHNRKSSILDEFDNNEIRKF